MGKPRKPKTVFRPGAVYVSPTDGYNDRMYSPGQASETFGIHPKTLNEWEKAGHLTAHRAPSGHRRYAHTELQALYDKTRDGTFKNAAKNK